MATMRCPQCIAMKLNPATSFFCGKECYTACWKDHKTLHIPKVEQNLASPPFSIMLGDNIVPLKAVTRRDENDRLEVLLIYSDHLGAEALRPFAAEFGAPEDPLVLSKFWYDGISFGTCSTTITDQEMMKSCRDDEFAFNVLLFKEVFKAMLEANILEVVTGKKTNANTPIVRLKQLESWTTLTTPDSTLKQASNKLQPAGGASGSSSSSGGITLADDDWVVC